MQGYSLSFNCYASFTLDIHIIENLSLHFAIAKTAA